MAQSHLSWVVTDEEKKLNATYIISVARKLGCSIFLLPEDIMEVSGLSNKVCFVMFLLPLEMQRVYV